MEVLETDTCWWFPTCLFPNPLLDDYCQQVFVSIEWMQKTFLGWQNVTILNQPHRQLLERWLFRLNMTQPCLNYDRSGVGGFKCIQTQIWYCIGTDRSPCFERSPFQAVAVHSFLTQSAQLPMMACRSSPTEVPVASQCIARIDFKDWSQERDEMTSPGTSGVSPPTPWTSFWVGNLCTAHARWTSSLQLALATTYVAWRITTWALVACCERSRCRATQAAVLTRQIDLRTTTRWSKRLCLFCVRPMRQESIMVAQVSLW